MLGDDSKFRNICLVTTGMTNAVCRVHLVAEATTFLHPLPQIAHTDYENDSCLPVLMMWENIKFNGVTTTRMDKE